MSDSRRWRTLMKRLSYLRSEASESVDEFESAVKDIEGEIRKNKTPETVVSSDSTSENKLSDSPKDIIQSSCGSIPSESDHKVNGEKHEEISSDAQVSSDDPVAGQYKKLWKAIAKMTHPDVVGDDPEMTSLYKAAAAAAEKGKREELLDVSSELGVPLAEPHPTILDDAERRCVHYENLIRKVRASVAWQWKHTGEETKAEIVDLILKSRETKRS